jgi:hypothetical protein
MLDVDLLEKVVKPHIRNRSYMSGVEREYLRVKSTGEVFTPTHTVQRILNNLPQDLFEDPTKTFLDNSCGDGQFLGEVLIRKMENGSTFEQALSTIYGVDLMIDNVDLCRERLLCGREDLRHVVEQNIYQRDALKHSYEFTPMSPTRQTNEKKLRRKAEKAKKAAEQARIIEQRQIKLFGKAPAKPKKVNDLVIVT